jgi:hypothetical protein
MWHLHRLPPLRLLPPVEPDRSAKVVALRSRSEARLQERAPEREPERSPPQPERWGDAAA